MSINISVWQIYKLKRFQRDLDKKSYFVVYLYDFKNND